MTEVVDQVVEGVVVEVVHPSGVVEPNGYLKVEAKVGHEMEETLGVGVEQIQALDSAMVGVELDQHFAMEVVEHQMMVGVVVVVHVLQRLNSKNDLLPGSRKGPRKLELGRTASPLLRRNGMRLTDFGKS